MPLQPPLIATRDGRSVLNAPFPNRSSVINRWFSQLIIEPFSWQLLGDLTARLRQELQLPPQSGRENKAVRQRLLTLLAYSPHVVPHPNDWPSNVYTTGYWFLDDDPQWRPPASLQAFLDGGPPPVYIGFGSMTGRNPVQTTQLILEGLALTGQRAIVSAGWAGLGGAQPPDHIFQIEAVPHGWLFPRLAAVVHHGGAGTTAAGLRAGVPSFIIPHFADQFYWGTRIFHVGAGPRPQPRYKLTAQSLADGILAATSTPTYAQQAAALGGKIRAEDGVARAISLIEAHLKR